jgi:hypothetical protein
MEAFEDNESHEIHVQKVGEFIAINESMVLFKGIYCPIVRALSNTPIDRVITISMAVEIKIWHQKFDSSNRYFFYFFKFFCLSPHGGSPCGRKGI